MVLDDHRGDGRDGRTMIGTGEPADGVAVVIPAFNASANIRETLFSVLNQTYRHLEIVVVDDGSTDDTSAIVNTIAAMDKRIRLIRQRQGGVAAARNRGIANTDGPFIAPLDADDLWHPDKVARQMAAMRQGSARLGLIYTWCRIIDEAGMV